MVRKKGIRNHRVWEYEPRARQAGNTNFYKDGTGNQLTPKAFTLRQLKVKTNSSEEIFPSLVMSFGWPVGALSG
eukprot:1776278-Pleurochrysis_carterae.AAC.1